MTSDSDKKANDLRGAGRLTVDAVVGVTDLVESMHQTVSTLGGLIGDAERERTSGITGFVYSNIRSITRLVGGGIDAALAPLEKTLEEVEPSARREAVIAALNGVLGDYLEQTNNPLTITMGLRRDGIPIATDDVELREAVRAAGGRLLVMVHGSSSNDLQWQRKGHNHGEALADELGYATAYLHYNSGRHISKNGEDLAGFLHKLLEDIPEIEEIDILAHSMGGLVARSAHYYAETLDYEWPEKLRRLVFLATPHHGAPLERYGNWVDNILQISAYSAPFARLGKIRSAGITDLRYGYLTHHDWEGQERFELVPDERTQIPLPEGVECFAVAATTGQDEGHVTDHIVGDGMVPKKSALGQHDDSHLDLNFPEEHTFVARGTGHLDTLCSLEIYQKVRDWMSG